MFEVLVSSDRGWIAVQCACPAGRAMFRDETAAYAAIAKHMQTCGAGTADQSFQAFATEVTAA